MTVNSIGQSLLHFCLNNSGLTMVSPTQLMQYLAKLTNLIYVSYDSLLVSNLYIKNVLKSEKNG